MIVVTDTSIVLNLCCLGLEGLLPQVFGVVLAPPSVEGEFQRLAAVDRRFTRLVFPSFIRVVAPVTMARELADNQRLHTGEIEALSLAVEKMVDAVLMDERAGRNAAAGLGLRSIGILGILIQAKKCGLLATVGPVLEDLESKAGFWMTRMLKQRILELVNE